MLLRDKFLMMCCVALLSACGDMPSSIKAFDGESPALDVQKFFSGNIKGWGFVQDFTGAITRRFSVNIKASWKGNEGLLEEDFVYDDGEKQTRRLSLTKTEEGGFAAEADDIIGIGIGAQSGNAFNLKYTLRIPYKGRTLDVKIDDWLILMTEKRLMNISTFSKFGMTVGRLTIFFEKQ